MALLKPARQAQYSQVADIKFTMADSMVDTAGATTNFKAVAGVFEPIPLPNGATIIAGEMVVEVASDDTGTATISVGDSINATRYLAATSIKTVGRTALALTGYRGTGENLRVTLANASGNATAGTVTLRADYVIDKRMHETVIA